MPSLQEIVSSPWFQASSFAVGILGVIIGLVTWLLSRKYKRIHYMFRSFNLVDKKRSTVPSLSVSFAGKPVEALTITKVAIWNSGKEAIREVDIPSREKIRIEGVNAAEILECSIIQASSSSCNCRLGDLSGNSQVLLFDFLDPDDGVVLQIAHTGASSENLKIKGQIVGNGRILEKLPLKQWVPFSFINRLKKEGGRSPRGLTATAIVLVGVFIMATPLMSDKLNELNKSKISTTMNIAGGAVYVLFGYALWSSRPPRGLSVFDDSFERKNEKD